MDASTACSSKALSSNWTPRATSAGAFIGSLLSDARSRRQKPRGWRKALSRRGYMDWRPNSRNLYRLLLRLYPAEFRQEYGAQMDLAVAESAEFDPHARLWPMMLGD